MAASSPSRAALLSTVVGVGVGGLAAVFVVRALLRDRAEIEDAIGRASPAWLATALVLAALAMLGAAAPWRRALQVLGTDLPRSQVLARYFLGEIGKYLPGGVWPVLGRGELARRAGTSRSAAYGSVALSLATLYLAAMFVVLVGSPALLGGEDGPGALLVLLLLPLGLLGLHPSFLGRALGLVERVTRRRLAVEIPSWSTSLGLVLRYVPAWIGVGAATWAVARALDPGAPVVEVATAAVLSWVVGFVLVPVPGGIGVREATFVAAASSLAPGIAATVAVTARVLFVLVDATGAVAGSVVIRRWRGPQEARTVAWAKPAD